VEMVLCCLDQSELLLTIEPVSNVLGLKKNQLTILTSYSTGRRRLEDTWILRYAIICDNSTESAQVLKMLPGVTIIPFMDGYIELLSYTIMSMEDDSPNGILENIIPDENIIDYILLSNLVLITFLLICSCVCCSHCSRQRKVRKVGEDLAEFDEIEMSPPGKFFSTPRPFSTGEGEKNGHFVPY